MLRLINIFYFINYNVSLFSFEIFDEEIYRMQQQMQQVFNLARPVEMAFVCIYSSPGCNRDLICSHPFKKEMHIE